MLHASQSVEYVARVFFPGFFFLFLSCFFFFFIILVGGRFAFTLEILIQDFPSLFKVSLEEQRIELGVSLLLSWRNRDS